MTAPRGWGLSSSRPLHLRARHQGGEDRQMRIQVLALSLLAFGLATPALAGSDTPPEGPPWTRDLIAAQKTALARKVPIFVYLTKTH